MTRTRRFGLSTYFCQERRLAREPLLDIGAHGFECIELYATPAHVNYHNATVVADLQQWLAEARLELHSVHAPVAERIVAGRPEAPLTLASVDSDLRWRAMHEAQGALHIARRIPFQVLVLHLGLPRTSQSMRGENSRDAARRSVEELQRVAEPLGVRLALEIFSNELSAPGPLVHFVEQVLEAAPVGICLDLGHAHLQGDAVEAVETVSEHLIAAHVHDNRGRADEHLIPFEGAIDWPAALTALQKVGYDGVFMFEVNGRGGDTAMLERARRARRRMEGLLAA